MRRVMHPAIYAAYSGPTPELHRSAGAKSDATAASAAAGKSRSNSPTARFVSATPWCGPNTSSTISSTHDLNKTLEKTSANDPVNMPLDYDMDRALVALLRDQGIAAQFQPPHRPVSQRRARQRPDISRRRPDQPGRPALSRPAGFRARRTMVGGCADCRDRRPAAASASACRGCLPTAPTASASSANGWLREPAYGGLTAEDIETLANDPPLPFFILFEAMQQPQAEGLRLGPLGSIIVSEVIFGALASARDSGGTRRGFA